ncbi:MAG: CoA transferase [Alphaproteobacteria bacterium]|jgi:formyl-CoA transferase
MSSNQSPFGALAGLKVVDLARVLGGPYCTQILADHGAHVIKVEPPQGDEVRDWGPPFHEGDASYFVGVNRNKRSIGIDLSKQEGRDVLMRMLEDADVLIDNYKTGTLEKWGIGYKDTLAEKFPRLIHCRISGYGEDGPLGGFPGYDAIVQAMAGWFSVNGGAEKEPTRVGIAAVDMGTGLYSCVAILMGLFERANSGRGQFIDMTLYDCAISMMHPHIPNYYLSGGEVPGILGNQHGNISPYDKFPTKTVEVFIGAGNNRAYGRLCNELGRPELIEDPRFLTNSTRVANKAALREELLSAFADVDGEELSLKLLAAGIPCGPVLDTGQVMNAPHTKHRKMDAKLDWYEGAGTPIKFSRTPSELRSTPPAFGAQADDILAEHGYGEDDIKALADTGALVRERRKL